MGLEAAVQLLTTALLLLQLVSSNPALPQSMRDTAQQVAQNAITEATRVISGKPTTIPTQSSTSFSGARLDVRPYTNADTFMATVNAGSGTDYTWEVDWGEGDSSYQTVRSRTTITCNSAWTCSAPQSVIHTYSSTGDFMVNLYAVKNGVRTKVTQASVRVNMLGAPASYATPSVSFSASPTSIIAGQDATLTWSSSNANRCIIQSLAQWQPWTETVSTSGTRTVTPPQTTSYRLICTNDPGNGKDGPTADKTITIDSQYPGVLFRGSGVNVNDSGLRSMPNSSFAVSGTASASGPLTVVLIDIKYTGSESWNAVSYYLRDGSGIRAVSNSANVSNGVWSAAFGGVPEGYYHIYIYDSSYNVQGSGYFESSWKG